MASRWSSSRLDTRRPVRRRVELACERMEERIVPSTLPPNFSETVVASGFASPTAMEFTPDGRLFVALQDGRLRVIKNGQVLSSSFVTLSVDSSGERGLLGVAIDPNFASNQYVYVYYTVPGTTAHNRVSRFTASGDVAAAGSELVLLDIDNLNTDTRHNGGAIHFGPDGNLYIAVGDNKVGANAQLLTSQMGKILRIKPDGSIPTDNPYYNQTTGSDRAIWAIGLRNPYTFAFGNDSQGIARMFINDVGENTYEKIVPGVAAGNYGWPNTENPTGSGQYTNPVYVYSHGVNNVNGCAITGGTFYNPTTNQFPSTYTGDYFFSDYCGNWIRVLDPVTKVVSDFASQLPSGTVDLDVTPSGSLYYLTGAATNNGRIVRIDYTPSTPPPTGDPPQIVQQPTAQTVLAGQNVAFSVVASGAGNLTYQWQRNGKNIQGAILPTYILAGAKESDNGARFSVLVTNAFGTTSSGAVVLTVNVPKPPVPVISTPVRGSLFSGAETITFSGGATDPEDGTLPTQSLQWQVDLYDNGVRRTVVPATTGIDSGSFTVSQTERLSLNAFYRITLSTVDSSGLTAATIVDLSPRTSSLGVQTSPVNMPVTVNGQGLGTPTAVRGIAGMVSELQAAPTTVVSGVIYVFAGWGDGSTDASRTIVNPSSDSTLTAYYHAVGIVPYATVQSARTTVARGLIRNVVITFDGQIDPSSAASRTSYWLVSPGRDRKLWTRDDRYVRFRSVTYSAQSSTATLVPAARMNNRQVFGVVVSGSGTRGILVDVYNRPIDGNRDGQAGGDYLVNFGPAAVRATARSLFQRTLR